MIFSWTKSPTARWAETLTSISTQNLPGPWDTEMFPVDVNSAARENAARAGSV
jgi:hypothetical protein